MKLNAMSYLRLKNETSQEQMADILNINRPLISNIESYKIILTAPLTTYTLLSC